MNRRHPEYDTNRKREHDIDIEKENQRLKNELQSKETELQNIKVQKVCEIHILLKFRFTNNCMHRIRQRYIVNDKQQQMPDDCL
jgi:hypothetical protein